MFIFNLNCTYLPVMSWRGRRVHDDNELPENLDQKC